MARLPEVRRVVRRVVPVIVGLFLVAAGVSIVLAVTSARDSSQLAAPDVVQGPGLLEDEDGGGTPRTAGKPGKGSLEREIDVPEPILLHALAIGDVAFAYDARKPPPALVRLRNDIRPFDPELAAAGQAVFLVRVPGVQGIQALAWRRRYQAAGPRDPQLRAFVDAWLGKGRGNTG